MIDGYHLCAMRVFKRVQRNVFLLSALETILEGVPFSQDIWDRQLNHAKSSLLAANPLNCINMMDEEPGESMLAVSAPPGMTKWEWAGAGVRLLHCMALPLHPCAVERPSCSSACSMPVQITCVNRVVCMLCFLSQHYRQR
jgi:hypothetical protein